MTWAREVAATSVEDLVANNSPQLLAHLLRSAAQREIDQAERHQLERLRWREAITDVQRIGIEVRRAADAGRKTVRIADLMPPTEGTPR